VIFGRTGPEGAARALYRPRLLLLADSEEATPEADAAAVTAAAAGFLVTVVPWFAIGFREDGIVPLAGHAYEDGSARRPLLPDERLAPDAVAPLTLLDPPALRVASLIGRLHPRAVLGFAELPPPPVDRLPADALRGVIALAPKCARGLGADAKAAARRLGEIAESLASVAAGARQSALDDPRRIVLAIQATAEAAVCGFRAAPGLPFQLDLFAIWLETVRGRLPPPMPLLLPGPAFLCGPSRPAAHPLAAVLPCPSEGHVVVATKARADASFVHLDPALRLASGQTDAAALLRWLGRTIEPGAPSGPEGDRLVEPGVGRTVLVDGLLIADRPDLVDFTALGVGVTPYAEGGYVNVGRPIDGMAGLDRSLHRRMCAERLEAAGCRAGRVVAVIALADSAINLPHVKAAPAGIAVRGFRCVLRVKQLDPVGAFLHSHQHAPAAHEFMLHPVWSSVLGLPPGADRPDDAQAALVEQKVLLGLETYAIRSSLAELVAAALMPPPYVGMAAAVARRLAIVRLYAPRVLELARGRLAVELGRDPLTERPGNLEYALWFADTLGRQLATFRKLRFLHDYHQEGVARWTAGQMHTLGENNLTLLAEFPDLDTGIFLDRPDPAQLDCLFLTRADYDTLDAGFAAFHQRDVAEARDVVQTLAFIALAGDPGGVAEALGRFAAAYQRGLEAAG